MKRIVFAIAVAALAQAAFAGLSYNFESVTTGLRETTVSGSAEAEGNSFRMNVRRGDGFTFNDGSFVVSRDGGKTLMVADPKSKTYYQLDFSEATGSISSLFKQLGFLNFKVTDPKVTSRDLGKGETIEGYPTRRTQVNSSYALSMKPIGAPVKISITMATQSWVTDAIPAELTSFLQKQNLSTGVPEVDKLIAAQTASNKGFPLKQVTILTVVQNGRTMQSTTTTTIRGVSKKQFADSQFVIPPGFAKTDNPIEKMMKALQ